MPTLFFFPKNMLQLAQPVTIQFPAPLNITRSSPVTMVSDSSDRAFLPLVSIGIISNHLSSGLQNIGFQVYYSCGNWSIPINTIFSGMNIHLPAILMFTRGTRFWHTAMSEIDKVNLGVYDWLYRSLPSLGVVDFFANDSWKQRDKTFCHDTVSLDHTWSL